MGTFHKVRPTRKHALPFHLTAGGIGAACLAIALASFDIQSDAAPQLERPNTLTTLEEPANPAPQVQLASIKGQASDTFVAAISEPPAPALPLTKTHKIKSGDSLSGAMGALGVSNRDAYLANRAIAKHFDARRLRVGQVLTVSFDKDDNSQLTQVSLKIDAEDTVIATRNGDSFKANLDRTPLVATQHRAAGLITSSLYEGMLDQGIPDAAIVELIQIFSFDVDFQRDIRSGDSFDLYYETKHDNDGKLVRTGPVIYGKLTLRGKDIALYRFKDDDGFTDYYHADGSSSKKLLMRTPIDGARISSTYGSRRHPVLGYRKMHKGIDFAAPRGTPIKAAGNGTIVHASRFGSFGNYVKIRHNGNYETAYAHMKGFAKGIRKGARVRQGQTIGYVGTTGRSTGPHLHYEVHKNGKQVNPQSIKLPTGKKLDQTDMAQFIVQRDKINIALQETQPGSLTADAR